MAPLMIDALRGKLAGLLAGAAQAVGDRRAGSEAGVQAASGDLKEVRRGGDIWQSIVDGIDAPALLLDAHGLILAANGLSSSLLQVAAGRLISLTIRAPELHTALERARTTGIQQAFELKLLAPVERTLEGLATPLPSASPEGPPAPSLLLVLRDRTEQEQLARMRAEFVANASHELRTPLASIRGFVETLQGPAKDDAAARERFLGIMQSETARMSRLIEDLLSLNRIEMREHIAPKDRIDLLGVVREAMGALSPQAQERRATIAFSHDRDPACVIGERDELLQVAQNLIQNAIKYGRDGGRVEVTVRHGGSRVSLAVKDQGIGIAPEHLPRLTERFYRVSAKASRERGGTGLGLAIVKHIVNRHGGELSVASKLGEGSEFTVRLPVCPARPSSASSA